MARALQRRKRHSTENNKMEKESNKINAPTLMETFDVLYDENHGGTFNGCLETLNMCLERFIKGLAIQEIPTLILDQPPYPTTGKLFNYLKGSEEKLAFVENGKKVYKFCQRPNGESIFLPDAQRLLYNLIENRNDHVHSINQYSLFYEFKNVSVPVGEKYCLIFNPKIDGHKSKMVVDEECKFNVAQFQIIVQKQQVDVSMDLCVQYNADLIVEVLTKQQFEKEYKNEPDFGSNSHALVILYGIKKYFVYFGRSMYTLLKQCFGETNRNWSTYYYRFTAQSLMKRMTSQ